VVQVKDLGEAVTNPNLIHEEIKSRLTSGDARYHSIYSLSSSGLLPIKKTYNFVSGFGMGVKFDL
jgi:hypothetical protein